MFTALILASNLSLQEEQQQREHRKRRDTGVHTTGLPGHPSHLQLSVKKTHSPPPVLLKFTTPWTLQSPDDFLACLQCPQHPFTSQNQTARKSSSIPLSRLAPRFFSSCRGQALIPAGEAGLGPVLNFLYPRPEACCQHSPQHSAYTTQPRWEGFSLLPSSKNVKCFLLDQRRSKLVNHTTNAAAARQLPRTAMCTLPANRRCNLLLQAELSIIPDINHQAWTKRPL